MRIAVVTAAVCFARRGNLRGRRCQGGHAKTYADPAQSLGSALKALCAGPAISRCLYFSESVRDVRTGGATGS